MNHDNHPPANPPRDESGGGRWLDARPSGFLPGMLLQSLLFLAIGIFAAWHWWSTFTEGDTGSLQFFTIPLLTAFIVLTPLRMLWFWHRSRQAPGPYARKVRRGPG